MNCFPYSFRNGEGALEASGEQGFPGCPNPCFRTLFRAGSKGSVFQMQVVGFGLDLHLEQELFDFEEEYAEFKGM